jgi:hypothetical protein
MASQQDLQPARSINVLVTTTWAIILFVRVDTFACAHAMCSQTQTLSVTICGARVNPHHQSLENVSVSHCLAVPHARVPGKTLLLAVMRTVPEPVLAPVRLVRDVNKPCSCQASVSWRLGAGLCNTCRLHGSFSFGLTPTTLTLVTGARQHRRSRLVRCQKPAQTSLEQEEHNSFVCSVSTVLSLVPVISGLVRSRLRLVRLWGKCAAQSRLVCKLGQHVICCLSNNSNSQRTPLGLTRT